MTPETVEQPAEKGKQVEELDRSEKLKLYDLMDDLVYIRNHFQRNSDTFKAEEKVRYTERALNRIADFMEGRLTINLSKLDKYVQQWDQRAEAIRSEDPAVREFEELLVSQRTEVDVADIQLPEDGVEYVEWGLAESKSTSLEGTMITSGMQPCCSLIIIDPENNKQTLAHVYPNDRGTQRRNFFTKATNMHEVIGSMIPKSQGDQESARYYIAEGAARDKNTAFKIYASLHAAGITREQVQFIPSRSWQEMRKIASYESVVRGENIMIHQGKVLRASHRVEIEAKRQHWWKEKILNELTPEQIHTLNKASKEAWQHVWHEASRKYQQIKKSEIPQEEELQETQKVIRETAVKIDAYMKEHHDVRRAIPLKQERESAVYWYTFCMRCRMESYPEKYL